MVDYDLGLKIDRMTGHIIVTHFVIWDCEVWPSDEGSHPITWKAWRDDDFVDWMSGASSPQRIISSGEAAGIDRKWV